MNPTTRPLPALVLLSLLTATAAVATPETVVWSARLENDAGPVDGTVSLSLALFDAATGGSVVHEESVPSALVVDGELVHELGTAGHAIDDAVLERPALFLQVTLNGETLSPRLPIRSVPYALRAEQCSTLDGLNADDVATDDEVAAALSSVRVPFSSLTGVPAGLGDGELTASPGGGLFTGGNTIAIAGGGVSTGMIANGAITSSKLAPASVTSAAIVHEAIGTAEIRDGAVTSTDIANGSVIGADVAAGTIRRVNVDGARVYSMPAGCGGTLSLESTCRTLVCGSSGMGVPFFSSCSGSVCSNALPSTCSGTDVGVLVR